MLFYINEEGPLILNPHFGVGRLSESGRLSFMISKVALNDTRLCYTDKRSDISQ